MGKKNTIKLKKAQFTISSYLIGIIVFTAVILAGLGIIGNFRAADPTFMSTEEYSRFNSTFNNYDDLKTQVDKLESDTLNSEYDPSSGSYGVIGGLINSAWASLKFIFTGFGFMNTAFNGLSDYLGVPIWVGQLIIAAVTISLVFAIFKLLFATSET